MIKYRMQSYQQGVAVCCSNGFEYEGVGSDEEWYSAADIGPVLKAARVVAEVLVDQNMPEQIKEAARRIIDATEGVEHG